MLLSAGCRSVTATNEESKDVYSGAPLVVKNDRYVRDQGPVSMIPRGVIYRTNGNYDNKVSVNLDPSRKELLSYPAPTDVNAGSAPAVMADGWLLDRRGGVGVNSAFLDWTYEEYSKLPSAPTRAEIMAHIIPDARVTTVVSLPMTAQEAIADTVRVNDFIRSLSKINVD